MPPLRSSHVGPAVLANCQILLGRKGGARCFVIFVAGERDATASIADDTFAGTTRVEHSTNLVTSDRDSENFGAVICSDSHLTTARCCSADQTFHRQNLRNCRVINRDLVDNGPIRACIEHVRSQSPTN